MMLFFVGKSRTKALFTPLFLGATPLRYVYLTWVETRIGRKELVTTSWIFVPWERDIFYIPERWRSVCPATLGKTFHPFEISWSEACGFVFVWNTQGLGGSSFGIWKHHLDAVWYSIDPNCTAIFQGSLYICLQAVTTRNLGEHRIYKGLHYPVIYCMINYMDCSKTLKGSPLNNQYNGK